jgi:hypothetical protein
VPLVVAQSNLRGHFVYSLNLKSAMRRIGKMRVEEFFEFFCRHSGHRFWIQDLG